MDGQQQIQQSLNPVRQQVEAEVGRLVDQYELGKREIEYGKYGLAASITVLIIVIVLEALLLWVGLHLLFTPSWDGTNWAVVLILVGFSLSNITGIALSRRMYRSRHSRGYLYENGLLLVNCLDEQVVGLEAIHWREIATLWYWFTQQTHRHRHGRGRSYTSTTTTYHYRLQREGNRVFGQNFWKNGRELITNNQGEIRDRQLGAQVERAVLRYLFPLALRAYEEGEPVSFGALLVGKAGIYYKEQFLPWSMFKQGKRNLKDLSIWQEGKGLAWANISYAEIANLNVFCHLIAHLTHTLPP